MQPKLRSLKVTFACFAAAFTTLLVLSGKAEASAGDYTLEGIGYREAALQQPKTTFFKSEDANGVMYASFNGGTNIFIRSSELNELPALNNIILTSVEFNNAEIQAPTLDEDDSFNSNPLLGFITYRIPSPHKLFGVPKEQFDMYQELNFYLSVKTDDIFGEEQHMHCTILSKCLIRYHRSYTPVVFYINPPVLYYEAFTDVWFDPKQTLALAQNLKSDEMAFVNTEIARSKLDFEFTVDYDKHFRYWWDNVATGQVGEMPIGHSTDIKMLWEIGHAMVQDVEAKHCSYDMSKCYYAMNVPVIFNISSHVGYTSGRQNLTIHGYGFNNPNITVKVAGIDCKVTQYQDDSVSCEVQPASEPSPWNGTFPQIGAHGLRRRFWNRTGLHHWNVESFEPQFEAISTSFETPTNVFSPSGLRTANDMKGWFIAPETTAYRFHQTCDNVCDLYMGLNTTDPLTITKLKRSYYSEPRETWRVAGESKYSDWVNLTKGQKYYINGRQFDYGGGDNYQVGVEINKTETMNITDHHHQVKEVQYISLTPKDAKFDTVRITIKDSSKGGTFMLSMQSPKNNSYIIVRNINVQSSASDLKEKIKPYYWDVWRSYTDVNMTMYDANGTNTTNATLETSRVYHIVMRKLIDQSSVSNIQVIKQTTATVTVEQPMMVQMSTKPVTGNYRISCPIPGNDLTLSPITTNDIALNTHPRWVKEAIFKNCSGLYDKLDVWRAEDGRYHGPSYPGNGVGLYVRFIGKNGPQVQMKVVDGVDKPLSYGESLTFDDMNQTQYKAVNASTGLYFDAIPFEMLRTYETEPQVVVQVGDYPAVCKNLTCQYNYTQPVGEVTGFTYTAATRELQLTGTNLPVNASQIRYVKFAHSLCTLTNVSNASLTCTLDYEPVCGDHLPDLVSIYGLVNNSAALVAETITCTVTSVVPTTQLNLLGGDNLTISGTQFPWQLSTSTVEVKFNDAQETKCTPQESNSTSLVCLTGAFDTTVAAGQTLSAVITINNQTVTNNLALTTMTATKSGILLTPPSANPTLKTKINITLEADFPYAVDDRKVWSVNATNISNPSYMRQMNVIGVDNTNKILTVMFGGAWSGLYQISIRHKEFGLLDTNGLVLNVGSNITDFSPKKGSIFGGTLVTITGTNFGREFTDNPVQISTIGAVGSAACYLQSISTTEIKCRLGTTNHTDQTKGMLLVFLKTSEEAVCKEANACGWTYQGLIPEVTNMTAVWDETNLYWTVVVDGTGMTGTPATTELNVNGRPQETLSVTANQTIFKVTDIEGWVLKNINLYYDVGLPRGYDTVIKGKTLTLSPKLVSVTPNDGSVAGSMLTARLEGLGPLKNQTQAHWNLHGGTLVNNATGEDICKKVIVKSYGEALCITKPGVINASTVISAKSYETGSQLQCNNTDMTLCQYQQLETGSFPVVNSLLNPVSNQIKFIGTNFFTAGYLANASYGGTYADQVTIDSATQVTATWTYGLPPLGADEVPVLWFNQTGTNVRQYANISSSLKKDLTITGATPSLSCSFSGGCKLEVTADGLSTLLKNDSVNNFISVCDEPCEFQVGESTAAKAVCKLPKMSTVYSNQNFKIETEKDDLRFRKTFGNLNDIGMVFDNKLTAMPSIGSSKTECYVGGSFKANHVGMLSQVKYFMGDLDNKSIFVDKLKFQASADNQTWTDLFTADQNVHEGWNYHKWENSADYPKFRFYRLYSAERQGCLVGELKMTGVETVDNSQASITCPVAVEKDNVVIQNLTETVTYESTKSALLTGMSPRYGTVTGGTVVTFTGTNFVTDTSKYSIVIDGRTCTVSAATTTSVTCTTDKRPGLIKSSLEIYIDGQGLVSNQDKLFRYVSMWSDDTTWGGEFAPMYMESVYVPDGFNLYVDVDRTPELNLIMVEGSIIFAPDTDPNHERFFDARYIYLSNAYMEVGTEEFPYTSKLTITMHGNVSSPYLPIFGNKCIAVQRSTLDMHGVKRTPTWTKLNDTVQPGSDIIKLNHPVDWVAGDEIAIASTSYNGREGEQRTIKSIDNSNPNVPVVTLDSPLEYKHFAKTEWYGDEWIDMRAEVGLLTRNVKFRGDPETSAKNEYGATIFLHSEGDDSLVARLEYIELNNVGQAFKVGRYAVHFHMIGAVHKSYCKGFGTHTSFNRGFTMHGTHYLRITENVIFNAKGHNIFIEDAVEKKNHITRNLIMMTKRSWSLLNTDQTPACIWITSPDNNFIDNACGGSDRYAYWYDLQIHAIGPHANTNVCPENERVGEFRGNTAHSCGRYGLRIFHNMIPRKYPCQPIVYDHANTTDPWHKNPPITAYFTNFTGWKNGRNGAIAEKVGDIRWQNFKVADNLLAGIEFSMTDSHGDNTTRIEDALIIGRTNNTELALEVATPFGIINPRTENFRHDNIRFYNFDWGNAAALSSCSHCFHPNAADSGARTIRMSKLKFDSSVKRLVNYQYPKRVIFLDEDGTLTGKGAGSWATPYQPSFDLPECETNKTYYGGVFCDNSVQMRRIAFANYKDAGLFRGMAIKILPYDDEILNQYANVSDYLNNKSKYGSYHSTEKMDPQDGNAFPILTGHKYKIHWGMTGLDYEAVTMYVSERWEPSDKSVYLVHNFTDIRAENKFTLDGTVVPNNSIAANPDDWQLGQNVIYNTTEVRETHFIVNGKQENQSPYHEPRITIVGQRCIGACNEKVNETVPLENRTRYWNVSGDWPNNTLPKEGDDVHIEPGWNMVFNLKESPIYKLVRVNGNLTFDNTTDTHMKVKHLFIRAGELHIGSEEYPMEKNARITLYGEKDADTIVYDNAIEAGNKVIANVNVMRIYGKKRSWKMTRLQQPALRGQNKLFVEPGLELNVGDRLGVMPTSYEPEHFDDVVVTAYNSATGQVDCDHNLNFYHWGRDTSTGPEYDGLDMRGEVVLLTRNVKIDAEDVMSWGGQIVTSDTMEVYGEEIKLRTGSTIMDSVEIHNCSQIDTFKAALRFESAGTLHSSITNSAIHNGYAWGLYMKSSANIHIKDNIFFNFRPVGIGILSSKNITFDNNIVGGIVQRTTVEGSNNLVDKMGGISICAYYGPDPACQDIKVRNNIVAGAPYGGFVIPGHDCGDYSGKYGGNIAHSIRGYKSGTGLFMKEAPGQACTEFSDFKAYKCYYTGAFMYPSNKQGKLTKITVVDNIQGMGGMILNKASEYEMDLVDLTFRDIKVYGEYGNPDCPQNGEGGYCIKQKKFGFFTALGTYNGKDHHIGTSSPLPPHKVKSMSSWGTRVELYNVHFINWKAETEMGMPSRAFELHPWGSDLIPMHEFYDTKFVNVQEKALGYFFEPPQGWAIIKDCGEWPCTAPKNTFFSFKNTIFEQGRPSFGTPSFQMIPDTEFFSEFVPKCTQQKDMNLWTCRNDDLGLLMFESEDDDKVDRSLQPIYSRLQGTDMNNKINSFMDHVWDGFYQGQIRLSRFPILVWAPPKSRDRPDGAVYDIVYTGTPAKKMKYYLRSQNNQLAMTVRIAYPSAESRQILKDGTRVEMNDWNDDTRSYGPILGNKGCGENRYIGVKNVLEFYLTAGCTLQIAPRDAIQTMVRMEWTMDEFFNNGGTTKFVDRVAGSLGIHASTIKIVSVYEGSVVLNYDIIPPDDEPEPTKLLEKIHTTQQKKFQAGKMDLGAPILDVSAKQVVAADPTPPTQTAAPVSIISNGQRAGPGYKAVVITNSQGEEQAESVFVPDIPIMQINHEHVINVDKHIQKTEYQTQINKWETDEVFEVVEDKQIQIIQGSDNTAVLIVIIAVGALALLFLIMLARYLHNKLRAEKARAEQIRNTQQNLNATGQIRVLPSKKSVAMDNNTDKTKVGPVERNEEDSRLEIFEEQYDINQEFRVFGIGDKTKGGVQSLQEKMNMADEVADGESSDSNEQSDDGNDKPATAKDAAQMISEQLAVMENPQSRDENHRLNHSAASSSSKNALLASNATPNGSIYNSENKQALPEDNEIIDEEEEEEEE